MAEEKKKERSQQSNYLLMAVLLLNIVTMGAIGYFQYRMYQRERNRTSVHDVVRSAMEQERVHDEGLMEDRMGEKNADSNGILLPLNGFTANLAQDDGPRRFIRLNAVLKFSLDSEEGEFRSRRPQIRDSIISILNSKRPSDLLKKEGKEYLKEEIKSAINSFLVDGKVMAVYYVGFQIN